MSRYSQKHTPTRRAGGALVYTETPDVLEVSPQYQKLIFPQPNRKIPAERDYKGLGYRQASPVHCGEIFIAQGATKSWHRPCELPKSGARGSGGWEEEPRVRQSWFRSQPRPAPTDWQRLLPFLIGSYPGEVRKDGWGALTMTIGQIFGVTLDRLGEGNPMGCRDQTPVSCVQVKRPPRYFGARPHQTSDPWLAGEGRPQSCWSLSLVGATRKGPMSCS